MQSAFNLSNVTLSSQDNWGPEQNFVFDQYRNLPFAPYNKFERVGKFCDTTSAIARISNVSTTGTGFKNPADEEDFLVVEGKVAPKKTAGPVKNYRKFNPSIIQPKQVPLGDGHQQRARNTHPANKNNFRPYNQRVMTTKTKFKDNAGVQSDWNYIADLQKANFDKLKVYSEKVTDICSIGSLNAYERTTEQKAAPRAPLPMTNTTSTTLSVNADTTEDNVILQEMANDSQKESENFIVYTTDAILAAILTVKNSVFPWDVHVTKIKNQIIFEQGSKDKVSYIDLLTVNENTSGNLPEDEKDLIKLCLEATNVNKNVINQTAVGAKKIYGKEDPNFKSVPDKKLFRYRRWELDNKIEVVVRSEVDAYLPPKGDSTEAKYVKLCALNEYDLANEWRSKLESNRGAVISTEIRNNSCKVARWMCQAMLADIDEVKMAFVSRQNQKDTSKHSVLSFESYSINGLISMINYRLKDNWTIIKSLIEVLSKQEDGDFALVKQPYKQSIRIYQIPRKAEEEEH